LKGIRETFGGRPQLAQTPPRVYQQSFKSGELEEMIGAVDHSFEASEMNELEISFGGNEHIDLMNSQQLNQQSYLERRKS
jgi:hypothetical protein